MEKLTIINVPFQSGNDRAGGGLAPEWLLRNGIGAYADGSPIWGQIPSLPQNDITSQFGIKNYDNVIKMAQTLREVLNKYYGSTRRIITIGGDHSIALGSIAGVLQHEPNIGVIWFDAHGDINTEATSPSMNAHGMPVAALLGLCKSGINDVTTTHLKPQNIFWVGARDLDPGEIEILSHPYANGEPGCMMDNVYTTDYIHHKGMQHVMDEIMHKMRRRNIPAVHLSFDIDGMDPSVVWATGTRVERGLLQEDLDKFINNLQILPPLQSMDFVEYNPILDDEEHTTGIWCVKTLSRIIEYMK